MLNSFTSQSKVISALNRDMFIFFTEAIEGNATMVLHRMESINKMDEIVDVAYKHLNNDPT